MATDLGPETMSEFFVDIDNIEELVYDVEGVAGQLKTKAGSRKNTPSQTYVEYIRLQKQNYDNPGNKPVAQAYKMVSDVVAGNPEWNKYPRFENLMLRKSLLDYATSTTPIKQKLITQLKRKFGKFEKKGDGEEKEEKGSDRPSTLQVVTGKLLKRTWDRNQIGKLEQKKDGEMYKIENTYTPVAQEFLAGMNLSYKQITSFLNLIDDEAPEVPYLLTFVRKDLINNKTPFGHYKMHKRLTLKQMELLGKKTKELDGVSSFWETYCWKLQSVHAQNLDTNLNSRGNYLAKLKKFISDHPQTTRCSGLRAIIMYNYMTHLELTTGKYDRACLMTYLSIPRERGYNSTVLPGLLRKLPLCPVDFSVPDIPALRPIGSDENFVKRALGEFIKGSTELDKRYLALVDEKFAKILFATTMLTSRKGNEGDMKATLLQEVDKNAFTDLRERVEISLCPYNKTTFKVKENVELDVSVKNVEELQVDVYELNPLEYYTRNGKELSLSIVLDGLAPTSSKVINTKQADPIVKAKHTIKLTSIRNKNGVWLVELVGNGQRTRCILRKGELRYVSKTVDVPGKGRCTDIVVLENKKPVSAPRVWVGREVYEAKEGANHVICSFNQDGPGLTPFVVEDQNKPGSATLHFMEFPRSEYALRCGLYVDRESLLARQQAKCIVRPALFVDEEPCSIDNLKNCKLTLTCTTVTETLTKVISPALTDLREFVYEVTVPNELRSLELKLQGCVQRQCTGPIIKLENVQVFTVNAVDEEKYLGDLHLIPRGASGYVLAAYGKNGEPYAKQLVTVKLEHRFFQRPFTHNLETNSDGFIFLGRLPDVRRIRAQCVQGDMYPKGHTWELLEDKVNVPAVVNVVAGDVVRIPYMSANSKGPKVDVYDSKYIMKFKSVQYKDGYVEIRNLPEGDFIAHLRDNQSIDVLISVGTGTKIQAGSSDYVVSDARVVELSEDMPLQITLVKGNRDQGYRCQLQGYGPDTRVHIVSSHLVPRYTSFSSLACPMINPNVNDLQEVFNEYGTQVDLAEEFVYVNARRLNLDKRGGDKLGVQLPCPSLVQTPITCDNPIKAELRKAATPPPALEVHSRQKGRYERKALTVLGADIKKTTDTCNLEWLAAPSTVVENLVPDSTGWVQIPMNSVLSSQNLLQIIATDDNNISLRNVILPTVESTSKLQDCRLLDGLDPETHYCEIREVLFKQAGESINILNWETTQLETIDDISDVFELFLTIAGKRDERDRAHLASFYPMTVWNKLSQQERLDFYGNYKCNEINLWLYRKDKDFFTSVIKPLVAGKVQKDLMDYFLLDDKDAMVEYCGARYRTLNVLERILLDSAIPRAGAQERYDDLVAEAKSRASTISRLDELFRLTVESKNMARAREADLLKGLSDEAKYKEDPKFDLTGVFEESRYYRVPFEKTNNTLLEPNDFWMDFATYTFQGSEGPFLSKNYGYAVTNLTEMLTALACLDLDYRDNVEALEPEKHFPNGSTSYVPGMPVKVLFRTPTIVLSKQLKECQWERSALSVSTNYFDPLATEIVFDGEVEDAFLDPTSLQKQKVYGCRVVVTNVSSQRYEVEVLTQIPVGSIPIMNGHKTRNKIVALEPFQTRVVPYYFYFPSAGNFTHWPAHVNKNGKILGFDMNKQQIRVLDPTAIEDTSSWGYMCRDAKYETLIEYLRSDPGLPNRDLTQLEPRGSPKLKEFKEICSVLRQRGLYCAAFWRNAFQYGPDCRDEIEEYLNLDQDFQKYMYPCFGDALRVDPKRPLGSYDPLIRKMASYNEFWTAANVPGKNLRYIEGRPKIANFDETYRNFLLMAVLNSFNLPSMSIEDRMCATYYMILMNRTADALRIFSSITTEPEDNQLFDYMKGFLTVHADATGMMSLSELTSKYLKSDNIGPALREKWRDLENFVGELRDCAEYDGEFVYESEESRRNRSEVILAMDKLVVKYKNLDTLTLKLYKIDIELMFTTAPFTRSNNSYRFVEPTKSFTQTVEKEAKVNVLPLTDITGPMDDMVGENMIFEVLSAGRCVNGSIYVNQLDLQLSDSQVRVLRKPEGTPVVKAYVKVYVQTKSNTEGVFYKDGYTDLRGRFDYKTVATNALDSVTRFGILVKTISNGADILYVAKE